MFWKRKEKIEIGIFIIHGFISTSKMSFGYLTEKLQKNKIRNIYMPTLQGHEKPEDIPNFDYKKCLEQIENEFIVFRAKYQAVYLVGFSMGGAIASYLASKYKPDKLVLVAPALKYGGKKLMKNNIVNFLKNKKEKEDSETDVQIESCVSSLTTEKDNDYKHEFTERVKQVNLSTMMNFSKLISTINKTLKEKKIECPARIYQSDEDELVPVEAALAAFDKIYDNDKRLNLITNSPHNVLKSDHKEEIVEEILYFLYGKKKVK
jgi:carboxylesterase